MKALITGASSGLGREMANILSKKGYDLVLVARDEQRLEQVKQELIQNGTNVQTIMMDVSIEDNCKMLHEMVKEVDLLINNAGFGDCGNFTTTDLEKEISMIHTNCIAYHILTKLYLIDMKKTDKGKILNVASIAGFMPGPLMATYYATKNYVVKLAEGIRQELKKEHSCVQISILCPGPVETNFNQVANVKFQLREASCQKVANEAIKQLEKGKFYIVPGLTIKAIRFLSVFIPDLLLAKVAYYVQKRKLER